MKCLAGLEQPDSGTVEFEGRPVLLYVEQEPARGQDSLGGAQWTVADALTEPMVAGPSAATPVAAQTASALRAVRAIQTRQKRGHKPVRTVLKQLPLQLRAKLRLPRSCNAGFQWLSET